MVSISNRLVSQKPESLTHLRRERRRLLKAFRSFAPASEIDLVDAKAPRTHLQRALVWSLYNRWCAKRGLAPMPSPPAQLRAYMRWLAGAGRSAATIANYISAVMVVHRYNGHTIERASLVEPLRAERRRAGPPRRARPLMRRELKQLIEGMQPGELRDARDAALLMLGWHCAMRSEEICGLDWAEAGGLARGGKGYVSHEPHGLLITLLRSKSSQWQPVSSMINHLDAPGVRPWIERWVELAKIEPGEALFRPIDKEGRIAAARLASKSVTEILRARILKRELRRGTHPNRAHAIARQYSSHSLRHGYCSSASDAGLSLGAIRARSRHSSDEVLGRYIRSGDKRAGLKGVGI